MDLREAASVVLKVGAWANLAGGLIVAVVLVVSDPPEPLQRDVYDPLAEQAKREAKTARFVWAGASLFGGALGWALCFTIAVVSNESRETHHIIDKLTGVG
jgi:hypothetical protein